MISEGPGTPSVGLKPKHGLLFVSGGSAGNARVVSVRTGEVLATYTLAPAGTPSFINDVILTHDAAWFTDSLDNALYRFPLGHHGHHGDRHGHGHRSLPSQADVEKVDLTGAWIQNTGNNANGITTTPDRRAISSSTPATGCSTASTTTASPRRSTSAGTS